MSQEKDIMDVLEKLVDSKDQKKIKKRTRRIPEGQTYDYRLDLVNESATDTFTFLAVGDSGDGGKRKSGPKGKVARPKFQVADAMNAEGEDPNHRFDFILHLGDLVYLSGSRQGYPDRVIGPYHHWLKDGTDHKYNNMIFTKPFLPLYGNHDYFDFTLNIPIIKDIFGVVSDSVGSGSKNGKVFERAFVDKKTDPVDGVLPYITGKRTRIPNRYYWFTHGPCAFFALDSNTLNTVKEPSNEQRDDLKEKLEKAKEFAEKLMVQIKGVEQQIKNGEIEKELGELQLFFLVSKIAEETKKIAMLDKFIHASTEDHDKAQLDWLDSVLHHPDVEGKWKIVYLHHQLYTSEASHTDDPTSDGLRANLRRLFVKHGVHLVLSGHSHCFEWVIPHLSHSREATDEEVRLAQDKQHICYIVSGGGGRELRHSILEGDVSKPEVVKQQHQFFDVAESKAYSSLFQIGDDPDVDPDDDSKFQHMFHFLRIDVNPDQLKVTPVGVMELDGKHGFRQSPILTKVFRRSGTSIEVDHSQRLHCVNVFRNKKPEADFLDLSREDGDIVASDP